MKVIKEHCYVEKYSLYTVFFFVYKELNINAYILNKKASPREGGEALVKRYLLENIL